MARRSSRRQSSKKIYRLQKPTGHISDRVQKVGGQHFGIVAIDCGKNSSCYLLADFFGNVLIEPTLLQHERGHFQAAIERIRHTCQQRHVRDVLVAIEATGQYHLPVQRAFRQADFDTRIVHPYTSKQFRQPLHPGDKTDAGDLAGIFHAATSGFGLLQPDWPDDYLCVQLLRRHRRDWVQKNATLQCQIRETLHAAMPGLATGFCQLWQAPAVLEIARQLTSASAVLEAGLSGLQQLLTEAGVGYQLTTLHKILTWAEQAPPGHHLTGELRRILVSLDDDRRQKTREINDLERTLAQGVVRTPYILLLAIPGINIVSAAELAGELGPMHYYPHPNNITGRAGLMPSRYQSAHVDHPNGPLRRCGNRRLRAVLLQVADNLIKRNHYFAAKAATWKQQGKDARWMRVKVAKSFSRLAYAIVAGRQLLPHRCCQPQPYILDKVIKFHHEHKTPPEQLQQDLEAVVEQLPASARRREAQSLQEQLDELAQRRRGVQPLSDILPLVLAKLGVGQVQSEQGEPDLG